MLLEISCALRLAFGDMDASICAPLDLLILTSREFQERPLREMDELVPLYDITVSGAEDPPEA